MPGDDRVESLLGLLAEHSETIDLVAFGQILEMDDEEESLTESFSHSIVFGFFDQAEETFTQMDTALEKQDLAELSSLGHFLKGSSATIGLNRVRDDCEKIQRYGKLENDDGSPLPDKNKCLELITTTLQILKDDYKEVETILKDFYKSRG